MSIWRLVPQSIKAPLREVLKNNALPVVLKYSGVDPLDYVYRQSGIGNYETEDISGERFLVEEVLPRILKLEHPVLFDVGANVGNYAKSLHAVFPKARIFAFEPVPNTFEVLRRTLQATPVQCCAVGLSNSEGTANIFDYAQEDGSEHASLFVEVLEDLHRAQQIKKTSVTLTTLDNFCRIENVSQIDFLKIDTEGNELKVLQGARSAVEAGAVRAIQFEFNEMNVVSRVFLRDFYDVLKGFTFYRILSNGLLPLGKYSSRNEIFAFQNILALNDALVNKSLVASFVPPRV